MYERIKQTLGKLINTGFFSIVISNTLVKIVAFFGGMVLVRVLTKADYGTYSYVMNAMGLLLVFGDLGTGMATLQFTQENINNKLKFKAYCSWGLLLTILCSIVPSVCVLLSPYYYPFNIEGAKELTELLFLLPFISNLNTFFQTNLRIHLKNTKFALLNIIVIIVHYSVLLPMSFAFGVKGAILSNYIYNLIVLIVALIMNKNLIYYDQNYIKYISKSEKKDFFKLSVPSQLNAMISQILVLMDVFMIGLFFSNSEIIASYKVATTIPAAGAFIPVSIMIYIIPYFSRNIGDKSWLVVNSRKVIIAVFSLCSCIGIIGIITSKWVISLIFGSQYIEATSCYIILLISFMFSSGLQTPAVNILYTQRRVKINILITTVCGVLNIPLNVLGIMTLGSVGAAIATMITSIIGGIWAVGYLAIVLKRKDA